MGFAINNLCFIAPHVYKHAPNKKPQQVTCQGFTKALGNYSCHHQKRLTATIPHTTASNTRLTNTKADPMSFARPDKS